MSATTNTARTVKPKLSVSQWIGHVLGLFLGLANVFVMTSADAREGDGFEGIIWIPFTIIAVTLIVSLGVSLARKSHLARRVSAVLLALLALGALPGLLIPDADAGTRVAAAVGILVTVAAAALLFIPRHPKP